MSRTLGISFLVFGIYFGLLLVPKVFPSVGATAVGLVLMLSALAVIPIVTILAIWSIGARARATLRRLPVGPKSKAAGQVAVAGISMFAAFLAFAALLPNSLPSGSYESPFNREVWLDSDSTANLPGQATPRQKMLADVIAQLPHKGRSELEAMLGPSMGTQHFKSTGLDLIYLTGPERDSFFPVDSEWLLIWLDANGTYQRHAVVRD